MNISDLAKKLDGREYLQEITEEEEKQAKEAGIVVVFGYSSDNAEFRGAISDEVGCYDGGTIHLDKNGIIEECKSDCSLYKEALRKSKVIEALWNKEGNYAWTYKTSIPHKVFNIYDSGEPYCRGIVFNIADLD